MMRVFLSVAMVTSCLTPVAMCQVANFPILRNGGINEIDVDSWVSTSYGTSSDDKLGNHHELAHASSVGSGPDGLQIAVALSEAWIEPALNSTDFVPQIVCVANTHAQVTPTVQNPDGDPEAAADTSAVTNYRVLPRPSGELPGANTLNGSIYVTNAVPKFNDLVVEAGNFRVVGPGGTFVTANRASESGIDGWRVTYSLANSNNANKNAPNRTSTYFREGDGLNEFFQFSMYIPPVPAQGFDLGTVGITRNDTYVRTFSPAPNVPNIGEHALSSIIWMSVNDR